MATPAIPTPHVSQNEGTQLLHEIVTSSLLIYHVLKIEEKVAPYAHVLKIEKRWPHTPMS